MGGQQYTESGTEGIGVTSGTIRRCSRLLINSVGLTITSGATFDVIGLYSCITHNLVLAAVVFYLRKYSASPPDLQEFILKSIEFLLTHNYFSFDSSFYLQIEGALMGSKFSPSLVNFFMAWWKEYCIFSVDKPYEDAIVWYGRYINDLLLVWDLKVASVPGFLEYINSN